MTIAILALITLLEGVRRVPGGAVLFKRVFFGAWRVRPASPRGERLQLVSWWSPIVGSIMVVPEKTKERWTLDSLHTRLEEHRPTVRDVRILGLAVLPALIVGIPLAIDRFGAAGFFVALGFVALLCLMIVEAAFSTRRALKQDGPFGKSLSFLSPFAAPHAADVLLEEIVRGVPPGLVARALLPFDEFLRWVRPYAFDAKQEFLIGLDRRELEQALAPPAPEVGDKATLWCPRCGATYVQGETCSECGVALMAVA